MRFPIGGLAIVALVTALSTVAVGGLLSSPKAATSPSVASVQASPRPASGGAIPGPRSVVTCDDLVGAYYQLEGKRLLIERVLFGITPNGEMSAIELTGVFEDGSVFRLESDPSAFERTVSRIEDLEGTVVFDSVTGAKFIQEELEMMVDANSEVVVTYMRTIAANGEVGQYGSPSFEPHSAFFGQCCALYSVPFACSGSCTGGCPALSQGNCLCDAPSGGCHLTYAFRCRGGCASAFGCGADDSCSTPSGIGSCGCY